MQTDVHVPPVSVILPVFNAQATVAATLQCLLNQTLKDLEIIVVNDASADDSLTVVESIARKEQRVRLLSLEKNAGVYRARAEGIKISRGEYVGFFDADDFAKPDMFEILFSNCKQHHADIAVCGVDCVSDSGKFIHHKVKFKKDKNVTSQIFSGFCRKHFGTGALWNKLYRRELIETYATRPFRWHQDIGEDTIVNIGCFLDARRIRLIDKSLYEYVMHPRSTTQILDKSSAFCRMMQAYAIAVDMYKDKGVEVLEGITELFARQLNFSAYRISSAEQLRDCEELLADALGLLAEQYPAGLACLVNRGFCRGGKSRKSRGLLSAAQKKLKQFLQLRT